MEKGTLGFEEADALRWFRYWDETSKAGGVVPAELQVSNPPGDTSKSLIVTGKVAMGLIPSNQLAAHQNLTQDKLTLVQVPRGEKVRASCSSRAKVCRDMRRRSTRRKWRR
ncbi:hypothetical protein PACILC2_23730 [Paenibacillus cisolokensis]|uniref:Uncharacterized protein n=1 Tax=Paenibacillus cisolokensis TaxID=1658519 RepID=A0ABQ4N6J2_9BACL|nr:hypothetical protein [Paenibacillus cisolokensis]GIQ63805.1 hypothetical protein PACILC2_23730 [Paenibacillus cisolokensis]